MAGSAEKLLDFSSPFDVALLDATVNVFYTSASTEEVRWALTATPRARGARRLQKRRSKDAPVAGADARPIPRAAQRTAAERVMRQLQEHPEMWTRVDAILETSSNANSKFFALQARALCLASLRVKRRGSGGCVTAGCDTGWREGALGVLGSLGTPFALSACLPPRQLRTRLPLATPVAVAARAMRVAQAQPGLVQAVSQADLNAHARTSPHSPRFWRA